jgi:hypothetical protein
MPLSIRVAFQMNNQESTIREVLECIGNVNRLFRDMAVTLRRSPEVQNSLTGLEIISYKNGTNVEGYLDAELLDGNESAGFGMCNGMLIRG